MLLDDQILLKDHLDLCMLSQHSLALKIQLQHPILIIINRINTLQ